jgi:O-methyltransferase involved in polyketide biosynthesis
MEVGRNIRNHLMQLGNRCGPDCGNEVEKFLTQRGFTQVASITGEDYKRAYFHVANKDRRYAA